MPKFSRYFLPHEAGRKSQVTSHSQRLSFIMSISAIIVAPGPGPGTCDNPILSGPTLAYTDSVPPTESDPHLDTAPAPDPVLVSTLESVVFPDPTRFGLLGLTCTLGLGSILPFSRIVRTKARSTIGIPHSRAFSALGPTAPRRGQSRWVVSYRRSAGLLGAPISAMTASNWILSTPSGSNPETVSTTPSAPGMGKVTFAGREAK